MKSTVNVVIFANGSFRENFGKIFHVGLFSRYNSYFLHKGIWVLFSRRGYFREEYQSAKNAKITPTRTFPYLQYLFEYVYMWIAFSNTLSTIHFV